MNSHTYGENGHTPCPTEDIPGNIAVRLNSNILKAIKSEAEAIDFYQRLLKFAPGHRGQDDISHALEDERIHLRDFSQLYYSLTGMQPVYRPKKIAFHNLQEGLRLAYQDELEAYEFYRDIYLMTSHPLIRDVFFRAMTDEIEHAMRFGFLKTQM
jgi:rubrerythrin